MEVGYRPPSRVVQVQISTLSSFLIMALVIPGGIISTAVFVLFPEAIRSLRIGNNGFLEVTGIILLVALVAAHLPFYFERYLLDRIWQALFPNARILERQALASARSAVITRSQITGVSHQHFDQTLSEFILFNNTSFWLLLMALARLATPVESVYVVIFAGIILVASIVTLLFACPFFKKSYLDALELLDEESQRRISQANNH